MIRVQSMYTMTPMHNMCVQGQAKREIQENYETHQIDQYEQEVVLDKLKSK
jgi:hypothetical protein